MEVEKNGAFCIKLQPHSQHLPSSKLLLGKYQVVWEGYLLFGKLAPLDIRVFGLLLVSNAELKEAMVLVCVFAQVARHLPKTSTSNLANTEYFVLAVYVVPALLLVTILKLISKYSQARTTIYVLTWRLLSNKQLFSK